MNFLPLLDKLEKTQALTDAELGGLLEDTSPRLASELALRARAVRERIYGRAVYIRGLIEIAVIQRAVIANRNLISAHHVF